MYCRVALTQLFVQLLLVENLLTCCLAGEETADEMDWGLDYYHNFLDVLYLAMYCVWLCAVRLLWAMMYICYVLFGYYELWLLIVLMVINSCRQFHSSMTNFIILIYFYLSHPVNVMHSLQRNNYIREEVRRSCFESWNALTSSSNINKNMLFKAFFLVLARVSSFIKIGYF